MSQEPYLNEKTFTECFNKYYRPCVYMVFNIVKHFHNAEDIVKDSFCKLWESSEQTDCEQKAKAFIYICSANAAKNEYKRQIVRAHRESELVDYFTKKAAGDDALNKMIHSELLRLIKVEIDKLTIRRRQAIEYCFFEELDNTEAANKMGISRHTLKELKMQAIHSLREHFQSTFKRGLKPSCI